MKALHHSNILILKSSALVVFTVIDTIWETVSVEKGNLFSRWKPSQKEENHLEEGGIQQTVMEI